MYRDSVNIDLAERSVFFLHVCMYVCRFAPVPAMDEHTVIASGNHGPIAAQTPFVDGNLSLLLLQPANPRSIFRTPRASVCCVNDDHTQ